MIRIALVLPIVLYTTLTFAFQHLQPHRPDPLKTPGTLCSAQDWDFKEYRYREQIAYCRRNVSSSTKKQVYANYQVDLRMKSNYTIDHLIPLSIGGNNKIENLWPEPKSIKALRDSLEFDLYSLMKGGKITQKDAVEEVLRAKQNPPIFH